MFIKKVFGEQAINLDKRLGEMTKPEFINDVSKDSLVESTKNSSIMPISSSEKMHEDIVKYKSLSESEKLEFLDKINKEIMQQKKEEVFFKK